MTDTDPGGMPMKDRIAWTRQCFSLLKEGGVWAIPRSATIYQVYNSTKTVIRTAGPGDSAVETVIREMGWTLNVPT
jgi:hypothetical protein